MGDFQRSVCAGLGAGTVANRAKAGIRTALRATRIEMVLRGICLEVRGRRAESRFSAGLE